MKIGDKVKVKTKDINHGKIYEVEEIQHFGMTIPIVYLKGCNTFYYATELEIINNKKQNV
jgi:hypothetical protein